MDLNLIRVYYPSGTNGRLMHGDAIICHVIELPWLNNKRNLSCIPEGSYLLERRFTDARGWHLILKEVPDRSFILFHEANNAKRELKGCLAPVSMITGAGRGSLSARAYEKLKFIVFSALEMNEEVTLTITGK